MDVDKKHILLVEDNVIIALAQVSAIQKFGYRVSSAYSGEKAVLIAAEDPSIDLILMDIDLGPGINGPEAAQRILDARTLPIVFLTSHSEGSYVDMVRRITRYGYVVKNSGDFVLRSSIEMAFALFEANTQLREREAFYRHLFHTHPDPTFLISQDGSILDVNDAACASSGRSREESAGLPVGEVDPNYPTDQFLAFWDPKAVGTTYTFESLHVQKDGTKYPVQIHGSKFMIHDKTYYYGIAQNLSTVKSAQRQMEHNKAILENLREINQLILLDLAPKEFAQQAARTLCKNLGYTSAWIALLDIDGTIREGACHGLGEDGENFTEALRRGELPPCLKGLDQDNPDIRVENPKESCLDCGRIASYQGQSAFSGLLAYQGTLYGYASVSVPTEFAYQGEDLQLFGEMRQDLAFGLHHAWEKAELLQSRMDLRNAERVATLGSWIIDRKNNRVQVSDEWRAIHGVGTEVLSMGMLEDMLHPADRQRVLAVFAQSFATGARYELEHRIHRRDTGALRYLRQYGEVTQWEGPGAVRSISGVTLDVTDFVETRNALNGSEDLYRSIIENTTTAILCADDTGRYISANQAAADLFGYSVEALLAMRVSDLQSIDAPDTAERYQRYVEKGFERGEFSFLRPDGQGRIAEYQAVRVGPNRHVSMLLDVTDRKHGEAKIRTLLKEKELCLTEVQHRIKNNLNTVASLITLQADAAEHPMVRQELTESVGRVRSIALLYDQLYNPGDGRVLPTSPYLENLGRSVVSLFPHASEVDLILSVETLVLDKRALSCIGIVANEFITNAMKHAFHGPGPHRLELCFASTDKRLRLKVADSGPGKGYLFDAPPTPLTGLGHTIVSVLAEQLGGTVSYANEKGCTAILDIPWPTPEPQNADAN